MSRVLKFLSVSQKLLSFPSSIFKKKDMLLAHILQEFGNRPDHLQMIQPCTVYLCGLFVKTQGSFDVVRGALCEVIPDNSDE
jgi:hypothetical protein